ncbi:hypothetical protein ACS0TY_028153 [Phlomoides rotata]
MDSSYRISPWVILLMLNSIWTVDAQKKVFSITNFGGKSDGKTDNKQALANAWKKACGTDGGAVLIPKGTYLVSVGYFQGPCTGITLFSVQGSLLASSTIGASPWLTFYKVYGLRFSGSGTLNGNGAFAWSRCQHFKQCPNRPTMLKIENVKNGLIQGVSLVNSKMFHLHIDWSENVIMKNLHISAPENSPNTDGIHVSRSNYVYIMNSVIGTGDDCVSIGDGCRNVHISDVNCGPGHGISIGSLGEYKGELDVNGITVKNCNLTRTQNGLRIKTWAPSQSSNVVSGVTFQNINLNMVDNPIIIDQYYCPTGSCGHKGESSVAIKGVKYINVRGSSSLATAADIRCSKRKPCQDIELIGVDIKYNGKPTTAYCSPQAGVQFRGPKQDPSRC